MRYWDVLREYYYVCYSRDYTKKTMKNKKQEHSQLKKWLDEKDITKLNDITTEVLQDYHTNKITRGLKPHSVVSTSRQVKAFFGWCLSENYVSENPMDKVNLPILRETVIETFTTEEVIKLVECFSYKTYIEARNKMIVSIMADTGIRVMELCNVKETDIETDKIKVLGKGRKERYLSISPALKRIMIKYERLRNQYFKNILKTSDTYILNYRGGKMSNTGLWLVCKEGEKRTGIKNVHPHKFRHYFAITSLKVGGIDLHSLSLLLGHSEVSTTEIYLRSFRNEDLLKQIGRAHV